MSHPSLRRPRAGQHGLAAQIAAARKADRHLVAELHRSMVVADRALRRLGAAERHALVHLRRRRDHDSPGGRR
ncbi:MAG TPA: hypothetical protein VGO71_00710 [Baekduia sp.]|jgi:hypothetical protein|nr:hypothetical protein [Baekduia sp.]